jgi:uncharacterized protein YjiS (DUF1127 family)
MWNPDTIVQLVREWRRRARSRRELVRLGIGEYRDLGCRFDLHYELRKPFWRP